MSRAKQKAEAKSLSQKHSGRIAKPLSVAAIELIQSTHKLYIFKALASVLFGALSINRKIESNDKDEGYQRVLSPSRVQAVTTYIERRRPIPGAIIVSFENATFDKKSGELKVPAGTDVGWVIDGQHRLAGAAIAARSGKDIELPVVAFIGLDEKRQIEQFVTINREAKNVPTSLYLDLLRLLPNKNPADAGKERAADLGTQLRKDEDSPFLDRIVVTVSPRAGQVSLVNFVRKIAPYVIPGKGMLSVYSEREQLAVISNYYKAFRQVFPKEFDKRDSIFFKTIGFGALWNAFPLVFNLALAHHQGFEVKDVIAVLSRIENFDFSTMTQYGSGNQAETNAGDDLKASLTIAFKASDGPAVSLRV